MNDREDNQAYLWEEVEKFVKDQKISTPETIYQSDRVIENAYNFIERLCNIVGYYEESDDE